MFRHYHRNSKRQNRKFNFFCEEYNDDYTKVICNVALGEEIIFDEKSNKNYVVNYCSNNTKKHCDLMQTTATNVIVIFIGMTEIKKEHRKIMLAEKKKTKHIVLHIMAMKHKEISNIKMMIFKIVLTWIFER